MAVNTGLRQGELLRLTWADIDWNVGVLTIHETKAGERRRTPMNSSVGLAYSVLSRPVSTPNRLRGSFPSTPDMSVASLKEP